MKTGGFCGCADVKSHQDRVPPGPPVPAPAVVQGNEAQDQLCDSARALPPPNDVSIPSGGFLAFLVIGGKAVTQAAPKAVRTLAREQAFLAWSARPVQGKVAKQGALDRPAVPGPGTLYQMPTPRALGRPPPPV